MLWALEGVERFPGLSDIKSYAIWDNLNVETQMAHQFVNPGQFFLKCLVFLGEMEFLNDFLQNVGRHCELKEMLWHCELSEGKALLSLKVDWVKSPRRRVGLMAPQVCKAWQHVFVDG